MRLIIAIVLLGSLQVSGQGVEIEFNKKNDFSKYKTFCFGEGLVVSESTQKKVRDATLSNWIINGIIREFEQKAMSQVDSLGDLKVTYALIRTAQLDIKGKGPLGMTPASNDSTWSCGDTENILILDLYDPTNLLIWRVKANFDFSGPNSETTIEAIVSKGFKKFRKIKKRR